MNIGQCVKSKLKKKVLNMFLSFFKRFYGIELANKYDGRTNKVVLLTYRNDCHLQSDYWIWA